MAIELKTVELLSPDGKRLPAKLQIYEEDPVNPDRVRLSVNFGVKEIAASELDFFAAMCVIRQALEKENYLLNCYGASRNVYPSAMSQDMGYGEKAYKLKLGQPARVHDLVSIFESGPDALPTTVEDQAKFYREWFDSLG